MILALVRQLQKLLFNKEQAFKKTTFLLKGCFLCSKNTKLLFVKDCNEYYHRQ